MGLQTDEVEEDKPLPVMFVPKHAGVDRFTTIEAGELFDYHAAVGPVLEVLIGTLRLLVALSLPSPHSSPPV